MIYWDCIIFAQTPKNLKGGTQMKTRKLLSFLLALVMAVSLAVPAFADETNPPEKELRFAWIFTDAENKWFAEDTVLNDKDKPFEGGLGMNQAGDCFMIFFIWNNEKGQREKFVVPEGDGNITVTKLDKDEIAKDAQQTQYYVRLHMNEFKDGEVTADGLSFHVSAMLDDFGFYSAETASAQTVLGSDVAAADLTDYTLYFQDIYALTDEADQHDTVIKVEKNPDMGDPNKFFELENVKDGLWKITINDMGKTALKNGGFPVNLNLEVKNPQGETRQGWRSIFIKGEEQGPELFFADVAGEWDDAAGQDIFFVNKDYGGQGNGKQLHAGYEHYGIFGTIKEGENAYTDHGFNWDAFTPVDVKTLKTPAGLTVESVADQAKKGEKWGKYFVKVTVAENGKEYQVTSGDYSITIDSGLPEVGVYTAPEASFDTWAGDWGFDFHPAYADEPYYIISTATTGTGNNRSLTDAKLTTKDLPEDCGNALMELAKVSDNVYKLSFKKGASLKTESFHVELDLTWTDFMGNTWTDEHCYFGSFDPRAVITASGTALTSAYYDPKPFAEVADKVSASVTMNVGEKKEVYLYPCGMRQGEFIYVAWDKDDAVCFRSNNEALTIAFDEKDPSKFTLSASKAGTYEVWVGGENWDYENMKLTHADGKAYTAAETQKFIQDVLFYANNDGEFFVIVDDKEVPFEEAYPGEKYELKSLGIIDRGWKHLTVTVTGEAKTFPDVKDSDWFAKAVQYACGRGLMNGTDKGFEPLRDVYNTEMVQILWNLAGNPKAEATVTAAEGQWYAGAVNWAASVKLIDASAFSGQKYVTRGEVREMMDAYGKLVGKDYSNLFHGDENGNLNLGGTLNRGMLAQVLMNAQA